MILRSRKMIKTQYGFRKLAKNLCINFMKNNVDDFILLNNYRHKS